MSWSEIERMTFGEVVRFNDVLDAKAEAEYELRKKLEAKASKT